MRLPKIERYRTLPIVGDGAIGHPDIGDGRIIPVIIVDCESNPQIYELIRIHEHTPPGDVRVTWGRDLLGKKHVHLKLEFEQPLRCEARIAFPLAKYSEFVDGVIRSRGIYLQPLQSGARVSEGLGKPKILIEIPDTATFPEWRKILRDTVEKKYRRQGASRAEVQVLTEAHLERLGELWSKRMNRSSYSVG